MIKSPQALVLETGSRLPQTAAGRLEMILQMLEMKIYTGKPGRPRQLITKKQARKLLKELFGNE